MNKASLGFAPLIVQDIGRTIQQLNDGGTTVLLVEQMATMALNLAHRGYVCCKTARLCWKAAANNCCAIPK